MKIRIETKVFIIGIAFLVSVTSVYAGVSWGTDPVTGDSYAGFDVPMITNTNGNAWAVSEDNLQAAIWDCNNTGGIVYYPNATCTLTKAINISHSNISLIGTGRNSVLYTAGDINILELYGTANYPNDLRGVTIEKITFKGSASHTSQAGITLGRGHHNRIHECFFTNLYDGMNIGNTDDTDNSWFNANHFASIKHYAMYFSSRCQENIISDNTMEGGTNCDAGIFMGGQNNVVSSNTIEEIGVGSGSGDGIYLSGKENVVNGNTVRAVGRMGIYCTYGTGVGNQTITSNYIEDCNNQGIYVKGQNHLINNNMLNNNGINAFVIDIDDSPSSGSGILISNNHIGGYAGSAIVDNTGNCTLMSNFYNNVFQLLTTRGSPGIDVDGKFYLNTSGTRMFEFSYAGGYSYIKGNWANSNMRIQPNTGTPFIDILNTDDIRLMNGGGAGDAIRFYSGGTTQYLNFILDGNDAEIDAGVYNVTINDVLKIEPRSAEPTSPVLGMIYVDSDDNHIYFYNGSGWDQMDAD